MGGATYEIQPSREKAQGDGAKAVFKTVGDVTNPEMNPSKPNRSVSETSFEHITNYDEDGESSGPEEVPDIRVFKSEDYEVQKPQQNPNDNWRWVVIVAALIIMVVVDGIGLSFGHLRGELAQKFNVSQNKVSLVGSLFIGIPLLTGPIMSALVDRCGCRALTIIAGVVLSCASIIASISNSFAILSLTYGLIGGLAVGVLYVTAAISVTFWFEEKRSLAVSIISCSFGIGPLIFAPLIQYLINYYNCLDIIFILGAIILNVCACGLLLRNPLHWVKREDNKKKIQSLDSINSLAKSSSLPSRCSSVESTSSIPLRVIMNMENEEEKRKTNSAMSPEHSNPLETTSDADHGKENFDKTNSKKGKNIVETQMDLRNRCKKMLDDQHYLKGIALFKNSIVHRSAMTSIPKYRLQSSLSPDVYNNSNWSLNSEAKRDMKWYLRLWVTPEIMSDHDIKIDKNRYILFNLCIFNLYAWSIFPYFFIKSFMDSKAAGGGTAIICTISASCIIGTVLSSWIKEKTWMNWTFIYRSCIILCGLSLAACPLLITVYWAMIFISIVYGVSLAICYAFAPIMLMKLVPIEKFSVTYCVALLAQGFGYLVGPLLGGMLFDVTGAWNGTFWLGGCGLLLSGILACCSKSQSLEPNVITSTSQKS